MLVAKLSMFLNGWKSLKEEMDMGKNASAESGRNYFLHIRYLKKNEQPPPTGLSTLILVDALPLQTQVVSCLRRKQA